MNSSVNMIEEKMAFQEDLTLRQRDGSPSFPPACFWLRGMA
jgi:hypothetical protein